MHSSDSVSDVSPKALGVITRLAYARAAQEDVGLASILRKAGITSHEIADSGNRINVASQIKFLELASIKLGDQLLGFNLAKTFDLRLMGLLYYVLASSGTLEDALRRGAR